MKKILSILVCVCLLLSAMVITASAAEPTTVTYTASSYSDPSNTGVKDAAKTFNDGIITFGAYEGGSSGSVAFRSDEIRVYQGAYATMTSTKDITSITLNIKGKDVTTIDVSTSTNGSSWTAVQSDISLSKSFADKTIDFDPATKYIKISDASKQIIIKSIKVTYAAEGGETGGEGGGEEPSCEHTAKSAVPNGDETHKLVCDACSETVTPVVECTDADINGKCDVCEGDVALPEAKTIAEVLAMADGDTKFYVTAEIVDTYRDTWATYGNFILKDDSTDETIILYGLHDEAGKQYDAMETKPVVGDTIKVLANRSSYKGVGQLANAVLIELIPATPDEGGDDVTPPAGDEGGDDVTPPAEDATLEVVDTPVAGTAYKFGMVQGNLENAVYYLAGGMDGYYLATTTDAAAAIDLYIEETTGGYYLYTMVDGAKTYINFVTEEKDGKTYVNGAYEATASTVYTYDADAKTMVATVNDELYWLATRNDKTYTTLGPAKVSFAGFYGQFYAEAKGDDTTGDDTTGGDSTTGGTTTGGTTGGSTTGSTTTTPEVKPNTDNSTTSPDTGDNMGAVAMMAIAAAAVLVASKKR